jgi:enamine deaminase RidA (YjgF/YER057c/UK114 family)
MTLQRLQPPDLPRSPAFSQVVVGAGGRTVFVSGQVSMDADGQTVASGDFAGQARQVHLNLARALEAAGATPADVAKLTTYVVGYTPALLPALAEARRAVLGEDLPASTLIGVAALAQPGFLIEVEAIAILD